MAGTSLDGIWLEHLQKSKSTVRVRQGFRYENMNIYVRKNRVTSQRLGQRHDVPKRYICNVATFQRVILWTLRCLCPKLRRSSM